MTDETDPPAPLTPASTASDAALDTPADATAMRGARLGFWWAAATFLVFDLASKHFLFDWLDVPPDAGPGGPYGKMIWILPGLFRLNACVNDGAAFGVGSGSVMLFVAATALLAPAITLMAYACRAPRTPLWALGMVLGGAAGNLHDRLFLGGVRDFFEITNPATQRPVWAVFNVADIGITVGVAVFLFWSLFLEPREKK